MITALRWAWAVAGGRSPGGQPERMAANASLALRFRGHGGASPGSSATHVNI